MNFPATWGRIHDQRTLAASDPAAVMPTGVDWRIPVPRGLPPGRPANLLRIINEGAAALRLAPGGLGRRRRAPATRAARRRLSRGPGPARGAGLAIERLAQSTTSARLLPEFTRGFTFPRYHRFG